MMVQQAVLGLASFLGLTSKLKKLLYLQQKPQTSQYIWDDDHDRDGDEGYWLSWRVAVEANNVGPWRTVPEQCYGHVARYMMGGQYEKDVEMIRDEILKYASEIKVGDGKDGWVMDVDDTCISNVLYYGENGRFGCAPFNSAKFKEWIRKGQCPAIQGMLEVFRTLLERGFKVFLVTGRDQTTMGHVTTLNLHQQGFIGYHRLFLRSEEYRGMSAVRYKSEIRRKIEEGGFRIWGNVGDQWSDLQGYSLGKRTFKLPNPMYFIS